MKTIRLEIELTYDDMIMHCGELDQDAKAWFFQEVLLNPPDRLTLHSFDIGDEVGQVKVLRIQETHKSQPADLLLRSGAICAGGAVDMQQPTAAPLPVSNTSNERQL